MVTLTNSRRSLTMKNILTYLIILFLSPLLMFAQEAPDYNKPSAPIFFDRPTYSWTDKVRVKIIAPSWNTDRDLIDSIGDNEHNPIKISTRGYSLEPYRLTETDPNSGIFIGEVVLTGFPHDIDGDGKSDTTPRTLGNGPTSGFLETKRNSAITVSFEFASGVVLTESAPIKWNEGTISFSKESYLSDEDVIIRVVDLDMNLNPESLDKIIVEVSSDSDAAGIEVDVLETSEASGLFEGRVSLVQNLSSSGSRLFITPGDTIYAKYEDYTPPEPYSTSDSLEVKTIAKTEFSMLTSERLINSEIFLTDNSGNSLYSYSTSNRMQIVGVLTNKQLFKQEFVYIFQIKDEKDTVVSVFWVKGEIGPNQTLEVAQSWTPESSGDYIIETFIWESLSKAIPISKLLSRTFFIE